jgi:O-antigen/teichoic acid export membrane protein
MTMFRSLSGINLAKIKTDFILFLNEVYVRVILLFGLALVYFETISLEDYFKFHVVTYLSQLLILIWVYRKEYFIPIKIPNSTDFKEAIVYGFNSLFDNVASLVVNRADIFMIAFYLNYEKVAIYNLALFMSIVMTIPNRAIMVVISPIVARFIHDNDYKNVQTIYQKSSLTQILAGGLIFILIWCNFGNVLEIGNLPLQYQEAGYVLLFLGISKLVDLVGSVNGSILLATPYFRYNLYFNLILFVITIVLNVLLIPSYGIEGAAIATAISLTFFNLMKGIFLYRKYKLQPFHKNTFLGLVILTISFLAGYFLPAMQNVYLDLILRCSLVCLVFIPATIYFQVSEDLNTMFYKFVRRFIK